MGQRSDISKLAASGAVVQRSKRDKKKREKARKREIHGRRQRLKRLLLEASDPEAVYQTLVQKYRSDGLAMANLRNAWKDQPKTMRRVRADIMKKLFDDFELAEPGDEMEDTDSSDGENDDTVAGPFFISTSKVEPDIRVKKLGDYKSQGELLARLVRKNEAYRKLAINLVMHNFRTSTGGLRPQFRYRGHKEPYQRPFSAHPGGKVMGAMKIIDRVPKREEKTHVAEQDASDPIVPAEYDLPDKYIPPSRFAVTLPIGEKQLGQLIKDNQELKNFIATFSSIGSFGFSERSKTAWEDGEAAGTRLSLGDSISSEMHTQLSQLIKKVKLDSPKSEEMYRLWGSPSLALMKAHAGDNAQIMERRTQHIKAMEELSLKLRNSCKDDDRDILKIFDESRQLSKEAVVGKYRQFIIRESELWEELMHASTLFTEASLNRKLGIQHYKKLNESRTTEHITVGREKMRRHLFPSGTFAAKELHEHLGGKGTNVKQSTGRLSTYTPYFEFYIGDDSLLNAGPEKPKDKMQFWINLSENAHDLFLGSANVPQGTKKLSQSIIKHVTGFSPNPKELALVIDYTKFSSDLPKDEIYPILTDLKKELTKASNIATVYYLKSSLKYNTGALERYQSGEVLSYSEENKLETRAEKSFKEKRSEYPGSSLGGYYVDLMRKVDSLSDYILKERRQRLKDSFQKA